MTLLLFGWEKVYQIKKEVDETHIVLVSSLKCGERLVTEVIKFIFSNIPYSFITSMSLSPFSIIPLSIL